MKVGGIAKVVLVSVLLASGCAGASVDDAASADLANTESTTDLSARDLEARRKSLVEQLRGMKLVATAQIDFGPTGLAGPMEGPNVTSLVVDCIFRLRDGVHPNPDDRSIPRSNEYLFDEANIQASTAKDPYATHREAFTLPLVNEKTLSGVKGEAADFYLVCRSRKLDAGLVKRFLSEAFEVTLVPSGSAAP